MKTILITGGAGFIGSNFIKMILHKTDYTVINFDKLTYAGNLENLKEIQSNPKYKFIKGDVAKTEDVNSLRNEKIDFIINFAAESHVDRSINSPNIFTISNVIGTQNILNLALEKNVVKFIQISTDEVYGSLEAKGKFTEHSPLNPSSPYAASKTAADVLALSYFKTYNLNLNVTRCSNNYGSFQFPEKLIPLTIFNAKTNSEIPVYGTGKNIRDWLYVEDHCSAILNIMENAECGEIYNIGGNTEKQNIEIVKILLQELNKPLSLIKFTNDRKAHDKRYAVDFSKIKTELGWTPKTEFSLGLKRTIDWYLNNDAWMEHIVSKKYQTYNASYSEINGI
jgi:dTDP-glucose 4,6-dehydratase